MTGFQALISYLLGPSRVVALPRWAVAAAVISLCIMLGAPREHGRCVWKGEGWWCCGYYSR